MWLKCSSCGNVYASGYNERGEWRDVGSKCMPVDRQIKAFWPNTPECNGILQRYDLPTAKQVYCRKCHGTYTTAFPTCPNCYNLRMMFGD
jgi:hypothetical protein